MSRTTTPPAASPILVCASGSDQGSQPVAGRVDWCLHAAVATTPGGHQLSLELCHDNTGAGQLDYPTQREANLEVTDAKGRSVWLWSRDHPDAAGGHRLTVPANGCLTWSVDWTDVDAQGRRLVPGDYTLTATSFAAQLRGLPSNSLGFTIK